MELGTAFRVSNSSSSDALAPLSSPRRSPASPFQECALEGDTTALSFVARALLQLQSAFGRIPSIRAKGRHAVVRCSARQAPLELCLTPKAFVRRSKCWR